MRHDDHRFEWTRKEFADWANRVGETYNYGVEIISIGDEEQNIGAPSQMAIFRYESALKTSFSQIAEKSDFAGQF